MDARREVARIAAGYDELTEVWASDRFPSSNGIAQHERALAFAPSGGQALDVGCGCNGRIIDRLLVHGYEVEGVDVSLRMIAAARERHPAVTFHHTDICEWRLPRLYAFVSAWDCLWHVPLPEHEAVLRKLLRGLAPGGVLIFSDGGLDTASEKRDSAMGPPMYYSTLGIPRTLAVLADEGCICRHLEYDQYPELHLYVIAQKRADPPSG